MLVEVALVGVGGGIGAALRYVLGGAVADRFGGHFPWHTFLVNASGAFLLGLLMALSVDRGIVGPQARLFLGTGVLGGYTTFSTLSYETVRLLEQGLWGQAAGNMLGSAAAGIVAVLLGLALGRAL